MDLNALNVNNSSPSWPVWAHDSKWAWRLSSMEPLLAVTEEYLHCGEILNVHLIDSTLQLFRVSDVRVVGRAGLLGWRPGYKGRYIRVEPTLQFVSQLDLASAKTHIVEFLISHPRVYETGGIRDELLVDLANAESVESLFSILH